jgi:hypothetical protein
MSVTKPLEDIFKDFLTRIFKKNSQTQKSEMNLQS